MLFLTKSSSCLLRLPSSHFISFVEWLIILLIKLKKSGNSLFCQILLLILLWLTVSPLYGCGSFTGKRTLTNVDLQISNLANLTIIGREMATRTSTMGVLCLYVNKFCVHKYNISRRGLSVLLILDDGQCESLRLG